jgi:hypothetical protein
MLVISIGLSLLLRNVLQIWFGGRRRPYFDYTIQQAMGPRAAALTPRDLVVMALSAWCWSGSRRCCSAPASARRCGRCPTTATSPSRPASTCSASS